MQFSNPPNLISRHAQTLKPKVASKEAAVALFEGLEEDLLYKFEGQNW